MLGGPENIGLILDFETVFLDDGIGEDFLGNAVELLLSFLVAPAVEIQDEEFTLANVFDCSVPETREGMLNGLSLRIEYGAFWHYPDVSSHGASIAS